jgi:hypothetical protein
MKRLYQALDEATDAQLCDVLRLWSLDGEAEACPGYSTGRYTISNNDFLLISKVQDPIAARFVWEGLSENERLLLHKMVASAGRSGVPFETMVKRTNWTEEQLESVAGRLKHYLLIQEQEEELSKWQHRYGINLGASSRSTQQKVRILYPFRESESNLYTVGREILSERGSRASWSLEELLASLLAGQLQQVIMRYGIKLDFYHAKAKLAALLSKHLMELGDPVANLLDLDPAAHDLFQWLREQKGLVSMREVREYTEASGIKLYKLVETLTSYGLAFTTFRDQEHVLFIPEDLYASLSRSTRVKTSAELSELETPPPHVKLAETVILDDLAMMIGAVYQQKIEPTQAGRVPKRVVTKLRPRLKGMPRLNYEGDDSYVETLLQSALHEELVQLSRSPVPDIKPCFVPGPDLATWQQMPPVDQTCSILQQWLTQPLWRDIAGANYTGQYSYGLQIQPGRMAIFELLKKCVPERWYSIESLLRCLWSKDPLVMRHESPYVYRAELMKIQTRQKEYKNWREADGEIYIGMLSHVLHELGLVSLGYSRSVEKKSEREEPINPDAFQLSRLGAAVLSVQEDAVLDDAVEQEHSQQPLIVQPSFEVLLMQQDFATLYQLLPFAQLDHVGMVSRLTLTRNSILRGLEHGYSVENMLQILAKYSQREIPQNVAYTLNDWAKAFQEAKISQVLLLEVSSEATATQLCGLRRLQEYNIRQVAPCLLLISSEINLQTLRNILEKEGVKAQLNGKFHTGR